MAVEQSRLLREHGAQAGPRWRVAVLHHQDLDSQELHAPGGLVERLRAANCMAIPIPLPLSDPFADHYDEWQGRASRGAYDFALILGHLSPPALALAVLADAPIVRLSSPVGPSLASIETAIASGHVDVLRVAEVALDDVRRLFVSVARVSAEVPLGFACHLDPQGTHKVLRSCDICPSTTSDLPLDVYIDGAGPLSCRSVEVASPPGSFLVELDGRPRRPAVARVRAAPRDLRIVRTDKYPEKH